MVFITYSCKPKLATERQKESAIHNERFETSIIPKLNSFENLKNFYVKNNDTIIKFNDNIPRHIVIEFNQLKKVIGRNNIKSVSINKDRINIEFKVNNNTNGLYLSHNLIWTLNGQQINTLHTEREYQYIHQKDTILSNSCIYRIGLLDHNFPGKYYGPMYMRL